MSFSKFPADSFKICSMLHVQQMYYIIYRGKIGNEFELVNSWVSMMEYTMWRLSKSHLTQLLVLFRHLLTHTVYMQYKQKHHPIRSERIPVVILVGNCYLNTHSRVGRTKSSDQLGTMHLQDQVLSP